MSKLKAIRLALVKRLQLLSEQSKMDKRLPVLHLPLVSRNLLQLVVIADNFRKLVPSMRDILHGATLAQTMDTMASIDNYCIYFAIIQFLNY